MRTQKKMQIASAATAALLAATQMGFSFSAFATEEAFVYCCAALSWAEYWEKEGVYLSDAAAGNWNTVSSDVDTRGETDLGAYDAVTRATSNHGLHRGSYQCTVKVYDIEGNCYDYTGKGNGESVDVVKGEDGVNITVDGNIVGTYDHSVNLGPKYVPVAVPVSLYEDFKQKYSVLENGDSMVSGYTEKNLVAIKEEVHVDANTDGLKTVSQKEDGTYEFSKRAETSSGKTVDESAIEISDVQYNSGYGDFLRVDIEGDYGDLGAHMYAVRWDYYGDQDTVLASYGTKFAADNWMHKSMGIQLGLTKSLRCQLPTGYESGSGRWDVTVYATGYQDYTFTIQATSTEYVYGSMDVPYADYYYGELNDVEENAMLQLEVADPAAALRAEGCYDAVTSATNVKSKKYETTYYTENDDESVTVEGIKNVAVAVPEELYKEAKTAIETGAVCQNKLFTMIENLVVNEDQTVVPTEYKILNGDGTLTAMQDANKAVTVSDATIEVSTNTKYGNYQLRIVEGDADNSLLPSASNMEGVVITMTDNSKYAMLHVDNLWLRTGEIAWATTENFVVHGKNILKYKNFEDTIGKSVASVRYIIRDGADVTYTAKGNAAYLPILHDGTVSVETTPLSSGAVSVTLENLPEAYQAIAVMDGVETTYADNVLTFSPDAVQPGSYTITVSDTNGIYAPISVDVILTTEQMPAAFDAETNSLVAAEGISETDFANYLAKLSTATINGETYTLSGRGSTKIFNSQTGALDLEVMKNNIPVFGEHGDYEITLTATGYTVPLLFTVTVPEKTEEKGDVDNNGTVSVEDAVLVLTYYAQQSAGLNPSENTQFANIQLGDIDDDGIISVEDAVSILTYYAQQSAGLNPTWDRINK